MRKALQRSEFDPAPVSRDDGFLEREAGIAGSSAILQNGKPVFTIEQVIQQLTRPGAAWTGVAGNPIPRAGVGTITYAFFDFSSQVYSSERNQFVPLSAAQRDAVRAAFAIWDDVIGVTFVEGGVANADINIGNLNTTESYFSAYANYPSQSLDGGDIWINLNAPSSQEVGLAQSGFRTLLHEIGHALGLAHPGNYDAAPGVTITYENNAEYFQDSFQYTIMSYFASSSTGAVRTGFAATPMAHDIAAIQSVYGADMTTRTGDTVYGFNSNAGRAAFDFTLNTQPVIAIWDAGGRDTLDFSGWSSNSRIDLAEGASSDGGGQTFNVQIAFGARIENAVGGGGDDSLSGNQSGNLLRGGGGNDTLLGGYGNDRVEGGAGADIFVFTSTGHSVGYMIRSDGKKFLPDVLTDFTSGTDKIDLSAIDANVGTDANDAFTFIGTGAFTHQPGELRYQLLNGLTHIFADTDGNGIADLDIIAGGTQILAADFIL